MKGYSATSRWVYLIVCLIVMAELVTVSGRGHFNYQSSFGPKERRKRQVVQNDALSLLSSLSRPAGGTPAGQAANGAAARKQNFDLSLNGGIVSFPGKVITTTTSKTTNSKKASTANSKLTTTTSNPPTKLSIISLSDVPGNRPTTSIPAAGSPEFFRQRLYSRQCWLNSEHEYKDGQGHGECCPASVPANLPMNSKMIAGFSTLTAHQCCGCHGAPSYRGSLPAGHTIWDLAT
ncbi:hypothetical protein DAPPUDRAFT_109522 [Daphnia pulex]|uniref:Uncharacterized protein n=1 Tax=Daphnia pulex TaxID=6669 RepID=E9H3D0_DAPPU|nr:hypothetical protein DAPPUDRAFT_109522 [Daphnia pulex]|eukprot:EFX73740.1 hypothetical protein DAPPUDRAFT_109522 [Daphnia pulex]